MKCSERVFLLWEFFFGLSEFDCFLCEFFFYEGDFKDSKSSTKKLPGEYHIFMANLLVPVLVQYGHYIRKTPNLVSLIGWLSATFKLKFRTARVSAGSMIPSSHNRAVL